MDTDPRIHTFNYKQVRSLHVKLELYCRYYKLHVSSSFSGISWEKSATESLHNVSRGNLCTKLIPEIMFTIPIPSVYKWVSIAFIISEFCTRTVEHCGEGVVSQVKGCKSQMTVQLTPKAALCLTHLLRDQYS